MGRTVRGPASVLSRWPSLSTGAASASADWRLGEGENSDVLDRLWASMNSITSARSYMQRLPNLTYLGPPPLTRSIDKVWGAKPIMLEVSFVLNSLVVITDPLQELLGILWRLF